MPSARWMETEQRPNAFGDELAAHVPGPRPAAKLAGPDLQLLRRKLAEHLFEVPDAGHEQSGP